MLDFDDLSRTNAQRAARWHPGFPTENGEVHWTGADWSNAMCGEAGEAANVVKKLRRVETGLVGVDDPDLAALRQALADELADIVCYADLLATYYGLSLSDAVRSKFNHVSVKQGFPERL